MTQKEMVLAHIQTHGGITAAEAMSEYGIARLSARIWDLRMDGVKIINEQQKCRNRWGKTVYFDRYRLGDKNGSAQDNINQFLDGFKNC